MDMLEVLRGAGKLGLCSWGDNRSGSLLHMYIQGSRCMFITMLRVTWYKDLFIFCGRRPMRLNERHAIILLDRWVVLCWIDVDV